MPTNSRPSPRSTCRAIPSSSTMPGTRAAPRWSPRPAPRRSRPAAPRWRRRMAMTMPKALPLGAGARQCRAGGRGGRPAGDDRFRGRLCGRAGRASRRTWRRLAATGAIGCNFEDQVVGGEGPARRSPSRPRGSPRRARRSARISSSTRAPTSSSRSRDHDAAKVDAALERAAAYAEAGASGFFVPGLADLALLERLCAASPLPVNFMAWPGTPPAAEIAAAGIARISHGPFPWKLAMQALKDAAAAEYGG